MKQNDALAKDYADYARTTYRPLEQSLVQEASAYDTPERRNAEASAATADVDSRFNAVAAARNRQLESLGINPGSARAMAALAGTDIEQAKAGAGAAYQARKGVETVGHAMKMDAASLGRNLAANQATSAQVALSAGNNATNNAQVPVQLAQSATNQVGQGFNTALQGQQIAGNLYGQAAKIDGQDNGLWGALGGVAGQFAGSKAGSTLIASAFSDENLKEDIKPEDPDEALEEIVSTPVESWRYSPQKLAAAGIEVPAEEQGENTGPMAQDVQETMGEEAAPGGKKLNLITMNGKAMLGIQALDKKIDRVANAVSSLASRIGAGQLTAQEA